MKFRLIVDGPLPPRKQASLEIIHEIRCRIHPQMKRLWAHEPLSKRAHWIAGTPATQSDIAILEERSGVNFAPLISQKNALHCGLHILFLRTEQPGSLISQRGDIDNRLKTLFDALRVPSDKEVRKLKTPQLAGEPVYCLTQDDALITDLRVETDRLLTSDNHNEIKAVITVSIRASRLTWGNMDLVAT